MHNCYIQWLRETVFGNFSKYVLLAFLYAYISYQRGLKEIWSWLHWYQIVLFCLILTCKLVITWEENLYSKTQYIIRNNNFLKLVRFYHKLKAVIETGRSWGFHNNILILFAQFFSWQYLNDLCEDYILYQ